MERALVPGCGNILLGDGEPQTRAEADRRTLVLGLGNVLLGDEGIGVWVAEALGRRFRFPPTVTVLEGGTLGLDLLPRLDGVRRLLLIDAVEFGAPPGAMVRLEGGAVSRVLDVKISPHQIGVQDLLAAARLMGSEPPVVVLWGMEPGRLDPGTSFSPTVREALPRLQAEVLKELRGWGVGGEPLAGAGPPPVWWEGGHRPPDAPSDCRCLARAGPPPLWWEGPRVGSPR